MSQVPLGIVGQTASSPYYTAGTVFNTNTGEVINGGVLLPQAASTVSSGSGNGGNGGSGSAPAQIDPETAKRNAYFSYLDSQVAALPGLQDSLNSQVLGEYSGQQSSINTARDNALNNLDLSNQQITSNKATSLRGLSENMANQLKAGNIFLGTRGAGDSSATNQYAYALNKVGTQARTNVENQSNQLYAQVETQMNNVKNTAQDQLNQLDTWKNTQLAQVAQYIQNLRGNIDSARANYIQSWLGTIDNEVNTYKSAVASWVVSHANSLTDVVNGFKQAGIGPDATINQPTINGADFSQTSDPTNYLFGYSGQKKDQYALGY